MYASPFTVHTVCLLLRELGEADERCTGPTCPMWAAGSIDEGTCLVGHVEPPLRRSPVLALASSLQEGDL